MYLCSAKTTHILLRSDMTETPKDTKLHDGDQTLAELLVEERKARKIAEAKLKTFMDLNHEIQTPLTLLISSLHTLIREDKNAQRQGEYEVMRRHVERLLTLINQVLSIGQMEEGQWKMQMCETDIIRYMNEILPFFAQLAKAKMIILQFQHDMSVLPVWIDRDHFDKAIINLITNAFQYTPVGGTITLRVEKDDSHCYIYMKDNGLGIPESQMKYVFNRFYEANLTPREHNVATGIGLDLTRMLIEQHHGSIEVKNNNGPGCEFKITLPLGCEHLKPEEILWEKRNVTHFSRLIEEEAVDLSPAIELDKAGRARIVVVEDEQEVRDFLVSELSSNYDVTACTNGREGLAAVGTSIPDLVVCDTRMPEMDGDALCSRIKSNSMTSHIPVVLLTTNVAEEDRMNSIEANADAYVPKPFNMNILRRVIANLLHRYQMLKLKYGRNEQLEEMVDDIQVKSADDKLLERLMMVINNNLSNTELNIDQIADNVGISRAHLFRKMKELTGQTPHDFIRSLRLKRAAQLLSQGDMSVIEVVYACGFGSAANFSTVFKKTYGVSPRKYMEAKRVIE